MSAVPTINWQGKSGASYLYHIFPMSIQFNPGQPGNYMFARETKPGYWLPVYVGEAECLGGRCNSMHEKWDRAVAAGATHIHAKITMGGKQARVDEETDLRHRWNPPCNDQ